MLQGGQEEDCWERVQIYTDRTPFISEACSLSLTMWQMSSTESVSSCCPPCLHSTEGHPLQGLPAEGFPPAWENTVVRSGKNLLENQKGKTSGGRMSSLDIFTGFHFFSQRWQAPCGSCCSQVLSNTTFASWPLRSTACVPIRNGCQKIGGMGNCISKMAGVAIAWVLAKAWL